MRVVVVGGGIVGASVAWHLARGGAAVTVVEAGGEGGTATSRSWAWINASSGHAEGYARLRMRAMDDWRGLTLPGVRANWCGSLVWDLPSDDLRAFVSERQAQGYDIRIVERPEIAALEPALAAPPELAAFAPGEGSVEPAAAARAFLEGAVKRGAAAITGQVGQIVTEGGRCSGVRLADGSRIAADRVVLAAGAGVPELAAQMGVEVPMTSPPGLLVTTAPAPPLLTRLLVGPGLEVRQRADGCLVAAGHHTGSDPGDDPEGVAAEVAGRIRAAMRGVEGLGLAGWTVGHRPMPRDGLPVVGKAAPGLHVVVTHSGVTLAPLLGRLAADEILSGAQDALLAPFGPERFAATLP